MKGKKLRCREQWTEGGFKRRTVKVEFRMVMPKTKTPNQNCFKMVIAEIALQLRTQADLAEDQGLDPSTHMAALNHL